MDCQRGEVGKGGLGWAEIGVVTVLTDWRAEEEAAGGRGRNEGDDGIVIRFVMGCWVEGSRGERVSGHRMRFYDWGWDCCSSVQRGTRRGGVRFRYYD